MKKETSDVSIGWWSGLELIISTVPWQLFELENRVWTISLLNVSRFNHFSTRFHPFCQSLYLWEIQLCEEKAGFLCLCTLHKHLLPELLLFWVLLGENHDSLGLLKLIIYSQYSLWEDRCFTDTAIRVILSDYVWLLWIIE